MQIWPAWKKFINVANLHLFDQKNYEVSFDLKESNGKASTEHR